MAENIYLRNLRDKYEGLRRSIEGTQQRAADAKRDLTPEELRSVVEMGEQAKALYTQIEDLSEIELRNAKVAKMAAEVNAAIAGGAGDDGDGAGDGAAGGDGAGDGAAGGDGTRSARLGGARTTMRDPGFYLRGGQHSYLGDQYRSHQGDRGAADRLARHSHALIEQARTDTHLRDVLGAGATTAGAGLVPPVWLADQFAPVLHTRLRLAAQLRQIPWAGPFPWTIPIASTAALGSSTTEGVNTTETDPYYTTLTVTPTAVMGYSEVSRQMLEGSSPAVDAIIWGDLIGNFYDNCETLVITAITAQANVNLATVSAAALSTTDILTQRGGILDGIAAISDNGGGDADFYVGRGSRWTTYLKFADTTGRPLIMARAYSPSNVIGVGNQVGSYRSPIRGELESLLVVTSPSVAASTGFIVNSQEHLFSVSPPQQFQFEQPVGPALVRVGIWGYEAVTFGRRPAAVTKVVYSGS